MLAWHNNQTYLFSCMMCYIWYEKIFVITRDGIKNRKQAVWGHSEAVYWHFQDLGCTI
ncbi:conserved hypothetical protein [Halomonas sp. 59]|nr:conserved hypothetical protein [Halomonas sp. 156]CAD5278043.1 conserved hypothetical protein [Halomonas sp. 113]CAD5279440.1 conserved hypothetical protein [Halomonas sp. 59]CAD5285332.1 conserved hypothetical protein [Halomonas sp. I3]VXB00693.1 conserved hypothetical protein [Halomonas titanicae]